MGELDDILRFGTEKLFAEDGGDEADRITWEDESVGRPLEPPPEGPHRRQGGAPWS